MSNRKKRSRQSGQRRVRHRERSISRLDAIRSCECPYCHAPIGSTCTRRNGQPRSSQHLERYAVAAALNA